MNFHPRFAATFGSFFEKVSESLLGGEPLLQSAELIRRQLSAAAVAMRVDDRPDQGEGHVIVAERDAGTDLLADASARLAELLDLHRYASATTLNESTTMRFTLWIFRAAHEPAPEVDDAAICEILVPVMRRGVELSDRMGNSEIERALYSDVMDRLSVGVLLLDRDGAIVNSTDKARQTLEERDGLKIRGGRLRASYSGEDRKLQQMIRTLAKAVADGETPATHGLSLSRPSGERNLGIIVQPIAGAGRDSLLARPFLAVYIRDPAAVAEFGSELLRQLFDLTRAEAAVAERLTAGLSLQDVASSLDISHNTARAHLRSIFSKSGISRQTELVRLMLSSAVILGERPCQIA